MDMGNQINFALVSIKTEQFAILDDNYFESRETGLKTSLEFKFDSREKMIGTFMEFTFEQDEKTFIKIEVSCHFKIEDILLSGYQNMEKKSFIFPKKLMAQLAMITVGTARGILFAKTEGSAFSGFIIPVINVEDVITTDVEFAEPDIV